MGVESQIFNPVLGPLSFNCDYPKRRACPLDDKLIDIENVS